MAGALSRRRAGANDYTWPGYVDALTTLLMVLIFLLSIFSVAQFTLSTTLSSRESAIDVLNQQVGTLVSQLSLEKKSAEELQKDVARLTILTNQLRADRDAARTERDQLAITAKELNTKSMDLQQAAEQKANMVRLTAEMAALKTELARLNATLEAADVKAKEQNAQIVDLGQKLNRALASKVEELARYRSEFFGKLREALAGQRDVQIVGDRFVFQSEVLFPSGSAKLQPSGEKQLANVAQRLIEISEKIPKDINWVLQVDGHTDNQPINTQAFPSNWELSAARAIAVVKFLNSQGIANEHLVAAGYGEYQPLSMMDTARNRRIELKLTNR
jgi:chemotaxis protein MotB